MSYYEQRLIVDLEAIREGVFNLGMQVEHALRDAVRALLTRDTALASRTIIGDHPINREAERLGMECHYFIAKHLPSAGHLRSISSALRMIILLERMGDYAVTICRESVQLTVPLSGVFRAEVEEMAEDSLKMFGRALKAFHKKDCELAQDTIGFANQVDRGFYSAYHLLIDQATENLDKTDLFGRLVVISQLERVSDQAKNLCEETVFSLTGETKKRRRVRILFVDASGGSYAYLAAAVGNKGFTDRAEFFSYSPGKEVEHSPEVVKFLSAHGLDTESLASSVITAPVSSWADYDVIVTLNGSYTVIMDRVPFHSVAFDWWIPEAADDGQALEDAHRFLRDSIENLVLIYRGEAPATG